MNNSESIKPIFILGIMQRCGTNYLARLLDLHPDTVLIESMREDFLISEAHHLITYARNLGDRWQATWNVDPNIESRLLQDLGVGLQSFLASLSNGKRPLLKTPSVANVEHFFELFPKDTLLIVIRDGRSVVESGVRSFGWSYEAATHAWTVAARSIIEFDRTFQSSGYSYQIIKYEDLVLHLERELQRLLGFLDLKAADYDFEQARNLPVYGSSTLRQTPSGVHWQPVKKTSDFQPTKRWNSWSTYRLERFKWVSADLLTAFGYEEETNRRSTNPWMAVNRLLDPASRMYRFLGKYRSRIR